MAFDWTFPDNRCFDGVEKTLGAVILFELLLLGIVFGQEALRSYLHSQG